MITIKGAMLVNGQQKDIVVKDGLITAVTASADRNCGEVISMPDGVYVSPGWIDLHTHAFPKYKPYYSYPDRVGYKTGVTTVVDAGSCGADDISVLHEFAQEARTRVLSFLNISRVGLRHRNELADLSFLSYEHAAEAVKMYPDLIVGLKARMSASVIGENGIKPLEIAKRFTENLDLPLMVHIGSAPPDLADITAMLTKGDIITHCFNAKAGNNMFSMDDTINPALLAAIKRGVYLDVGHGTSSFSYDIAEKALKDNVPFHSISTDIYEDNRINGPVYNMATTLNKFLALGCTLEDVIHRVTRAPADIIGKTNLGRLQKGKVADLTFFTIEKNDVNLIDSTGKQINAPVQIKPYSVLMGGVYYECE